VDFIKTEVISTFWINAEKAATARGLDIKELALSAGARPGDRVMLEQAEDIKKRLCAAGPPVSLQELLIKQ
jgi:hypothetical protein